MLAHHRLAAVTLAGLVLTVGLFAGTAQASTYYTVDDALSGPMHLGLQGAPAIGYDANLWTFNLRATNTGAETLNDVYFVQQFMWDYPGFQNAFTWDNTNKLWRYPSDDWTLKTWDAVPEQNGLMSMSRTNVDTPLSWTKFGTLATVTENDLLPAISLGNFAGGQFKDFNLYTAAPTSRPFDTVGFFVALTVPEPSTLGLLGAGGLGLLAWAWRRRRRGN
jgi:hypothetical protein